MLPVDSKAIYAILPASLFVQGIVVYFVTPIPDSLFQGSVLLGLAVLLVYATPWEKS